MIYYFWWKKMKKRVKMLTMILRYFSMNRSLKSNSLITWILHWGFLIFNRVWKWKFSFQYFFQKNLSFIQLTGPLVVNSDTLNSTIIFPSCQCLEGFEPIPGI
jgi:hypothetical protein